MCFVEDAFSIYNDIRPFEQKIAYLNYDKKIKVECTLPFPVNFWSI